jgi:hypothetical protein
MPPNFKGEPSRPDTDYTLGKKLRLADLCWLNEWRESSGKTSSQARAMEKWWRYRWSHMSARNKRLIEEFLAKHVTTSQR